MKRTIIAIATLALAASVFAQGKIGYVNSAGTAVKDASAGGANFTGLVGFYFDPSSPTNQNLADMRLFPGSIKTLNSGVFPTAPTALTLTNSTGPIVGPGTVYFVLKAWSSGYASYEAALAAANGVDIKGGVSGVFGIAPTILATDGTPSLVNSSSPALTSFSVNILPPVPEPSTIALAGLGLAGLLAFRRKSA